MIVPTSRFWILLAIGMFFPLAGLIIPALGAFLLPYNVVLFSLLFVTSLMTARPGDLAFKRKLDPVLSNRVENVIELTIANESLKPIQFRLRDSSPEWVVARGNDFAMLLESGEEKSVTYHLTPRQRGKEYFEDPFIRILAPLGLVEVERRLPGFAEVHVYPNVLALKQFDLLKQRGRLAQLGIRKARLKGRGSEFESLRDYDNDSFRQIDWKSTARRGKLMVREYTVERNQPVMVCIDCGRSMMSEVGGVSKLDFALDATLLLLHAAADGGDLTGLMVFDDRVQNLILPRKGRSQMGIILNAVHDLNAKPVETNFVGAFAHLASRQKRRTLMVIFTDAEDPEQARALTRALAPLRRRHLIFLVRVVDPKVKEQMELPLLVEDDIYVRASALWYDSQRRSATANLSTSGVQNIEAEPEDLAQTLVGAYLLAKEQLAI